MRSLGATGFVDALLLAASCVGAFTRWDNFSTTAVFLIGFLVLGGPEEKRARAGVFRAAWASSCRRLLLHLPIL